MEKNYLIQDVKTKEYYTSYRCDEEFQSNVSEASKFESEIDACREIISDKEYIADVFDGRVLEIKVYYNL